jgi:hypothetical protein
MAETKATYSLSGFRDFRDQVRRLLAAAGADPRTANDRDVILAWLAEESPAQFAGRIIDRFAGQGGA